MVKSTYPGSGRASTSSKSYGVSISYGISTSTRGNPSSSQYNAYQTRSSYQNPSSNSYPSGGLERALDNSSQGIIPFYASSLFELWRKRKKEDEERAKKVDWRYSNLYQLLKQEEKGG